MHVTVQAFTTFIRRMMGDTTIRRVPTPLPLVLPAIHSNGMMARVLRRHTEKPPPPTMHMIKRPRFGIMAYIPIMSATATVFRADPTIQNITMFLRKRGPRKIFASLDLGESDAINVRTMSRYMNSRNRSMVTA
jgi:hypothetical protein